MLSRLNQLNDAVTKAKMARVQKETQYSQVKSLMPAVGLDAVPVDSIPLVAQNTQIQSLKGKLLDLQHQKIQLSERYGEKHPDFIKVNASLASAEKQLEAETRKAVQNARNEYEQAVTQERVMQESLNEAKRAASDLGRKGVDYSVLQRNAESNQRVYDQLITREKELRVVANSRTNNVRVVDRAQTPGGAWG